MKNTAAPTIATRGPHTHTHTHIPPRDHVSLAHGQKFAPRLAMASGATNTPMGRSAWRDSGQHIGESAWLPPCMILVINDNLYGLIFALSSMCRLSFSLCQDHLLIKTKLACLLWLESRSRLEDHLLIMAKLVSMCWSQGALLDLHLLESSSREEKEEEVCVDQGFVRIDQHSSPSEDMPKRALPILVYGGASCESSPSEAR